MLKLSILALAMAVSANAFGSDSEAVSACLKKAKSQQISFVAEMYPHSGVSSSMVTVPVVTSNEAFNVTVVANLVDDRDGEKTVTVPVEATQVSRGVNCKLRVVHPTVYRE